MRRILRQTKARTTTKYGGPSPFDSAQGQDGDEKLTIAKTLNGSFLSGSSWHLLPSQAIQAAMLRLKVDGTR
jgi:hypothetical protein